MNNQPTQPPRRRTIRRRGFIVTESRYIDFRGEPKVVCEVRDHHGMFAQRFDALEQALAFVDRQPRH